MNITTKKDTWALKSPFTTARHYYEAIDTVTVHVSKGGHEGIGEAVGVDLVGESAESIIGQISEFATGLQGSLDHATLQDQLPPGGARNGLDCALWDWQCKMEGKSIWQLLDLTPTPVTTVYTIPLQSADDMAQLAEDAKDYPHLKIKLDDEQPVEKIKAIRSVRPKASLIIDCNQGWDLHLLREAAPAMHDLGVRMIEQPLKAGEDEALIDFRSPVPLCADESCNTSADLDYLAPRYQMVNIKLDKTGGLTEALKLAHQAMDMRLGLMVGNMLGSSLGMAPAFVIAQWCKFVDLDGPLLQREDRRHPLQYDHATIAVPSTLLWG